MHTQTSRDTLTTGQPFGAPPGGRRNLRVADWLYRSRAASVIWLIARLWLGYSWLNAGYQKLWGGPMIGNRFRPGPRTVTPVTSPPTAPTPVPAPAPAS